MNDLGGYREEGKEQGRLEDLGGDIMSQQFRHYDDKESHILSLTVLYPAVFWLVLCITSFSRLPKYQPLNLLEILFLWGCHM